MNNSQFFNRHAFGSVVSRESEDVIDSNFKAQLKSGFITWLCGLQSGVNQIAVAIRRICENQAS